MALPGRVHMSVAPVGQWVMGYESWAPGVFPFLNILAPPA